MKEKKSKYIVLFILFVITSLIIGGVSYLCNEFSVSFEGIVYTVTNNIEGTANDVYLSAIKYIGKYVLNGILIYILLMMITSPSKYKTFFEIKMFDKLIPINGKKSFFSFIYFILFSTIIVTLFYANKNLEITSFFRNQNIRSTIYEQYYVNPKEVTITADEKTKNIIYIYLEGMETSFSSRNEGGYQDENLISNLETLAEHNLNFSFDENVGGFNAPSKTDFTIAAIFSSESGAGYNFPVGNHMNPDLPFADNIVTLGDVLKLHGYNQEFLCGSDARFAARNSFFQTHGNFSIYDYYSAVNDGYTDAYVWWGLEDRLLYEIAKDRITMLASKGEPFNFTMLTVDTHHKEGYMCELCENKYDLQFKNVIECADRQLLSFIEWIQEQDFYDNTMIVISGDHPTMDGSLVNGIPYENRYVYNCFINSSQSSLHCKNRKFNTFDMFPTILSGLGFIIDGDRLGLGTNLFSGKKTLQENLGYEYINSELSKRSNYFEENFY